MSEDGDGLEWSRHQFEPLRLERFRHQLQPLSQRIYRLLLKELRWHQRRNKRLRAKVTYQRFAGKGRPPKWEPDDADRQRVVDLLAANLKDAGFTLISVQFGSVRIVGQYELVETTISCT